MEISDNGKSFPVEKTFLAKNPKRLGLVGMKERIEMVGGTLTIESTPGKGTTVRVQVPFNPKETLNDRSYYSRTTFAADNDIVPRPALSALNLLETQRGVFTP
jgi:hypothetical protein